MSLHPRRHRWRTQWATVVWLTVVWVFLWGDLSVGNVLAGLLIALAVTTGLRMAPIDFHGRFRPLGFAAAVRPVRRRPGEGVVRGQPHRDPARGTCRAAR